MAITVAMRTQVSQLYVSLFGRAPDGEGLGFWVAALAGGMTMAQIAESMYNTAPARTYYPAFATNQEIVATFYLNVLGRPADAEGLAFWTAELTNAPSKGAFFTKLLGNVVNYTGSNADGLKSQALFLNKVAVAQFYGENNGKIDGATAALNGVTEVPASVDAAKAAIIGATGQNYVLTANVDNIVGTAGNDIVTGVIGDPINANNTYNVGDVIDGGVGNDTVNLVAQGDTASNFTAIVRYVETISILNPGDATLNAALIEHAPTINFTSTSDDKTSAVNGAALASTIGLQGKGNLTVDYASTSGATDAAKVSLTSVGTSATNRSTINLADGSTIESVSIATTGTNFVSLNAGTAAAKVTVTGNGTNDIDVSSVGVVASSVTLDASTSTGANTFVMGTALSGNDAIKGGTGADTLTATINTTTTTTPTMTGVETAKLTYAATGTLDLSDTEGLVTVNLTPNVDASLSEASAALKTVNIATAASGLPDVNVGYRNDVAGDLTFNIGGTAAIGLDDMELAHVSKLAFNFTGTEANSVDIDQVNVTGAPTIALSVSAAANSNAAINDLYASAITSFDMAVALNAHADFSGYASGNIGNVNIDVASSTSAYAELEATSGGIGNISLDAKGFSASADVYVYAYSGGAGDITVAASGGEASAYVSAYVSGGDIGSVNVDALNNADGDASASVSAVYMLDADGEVVGGNVGDVTLNIVGLKASGEVDVTADGGDIASLTISVNGASGSGDLDASAYAVLNSAGDAVGGNIGSITISAIGGASADPDVDARAYGVINGDGDYKGGGQIGDIEIYVNGASAEAQAFAYAYDGGSVGSVDIVVDSTDSYSASGNVYAYVYGSGGQVSTIGDVTFAVLNPTDSSAGVDLAAYSGGNIGNITGSVQGGISGHISINASAYQNEDGSGGDIGNITWTDTSLGGDHYESLFAEGSIGNITNSIGGASANLYMEINGAETVGDVTVSFASTHIGSGGGINIGNYEDVGDVGVVTIKGGSINSTIYVSGGSGFDSSVDSIAAVDLSLFEGSAYIDLDRVLTGAEIFASKGSSFIIGTVSSDRIYLGAKTDTVVFLDLTPSDFIYNFKTGATAGDVLDLIATAGTLKDVLSANLEDPTEADANAIIRLVDIAGGNDITTEAGLKAALNDGEYDNIDSNFDEAYTFVTAGSASSTTLYVFHATADSDDDGVFDAIKLVGVVEATGALSTLVAGNFA